MMDHVTRVPLLCASCFVILFALSGATSVIGSERNDESSTDDIWALLVAGSMGWMNYRHQADVCHAYQLLRAHGVAEDHIIVMMADDIAYNENNPTPGVIINKPDGDNVYIDVPRDYTGQNVTVENFINILKGNKSAMDGIGSGKVIESGPNSYLFVNLVDHGAPGIFAFPEEYLYARRLNEVIQELHDNKKYKEMVVYVESCESGSIFDGLLPSNINVYATTAANPNENSYACYYDATLETYLGDVYSVKWMENVDKDGTRETLRKQYELVKQETTTSHVMHYGNLMMGWHRISRFMGSKQVDSLVDSGNDTQPCKDAVASGDVPIAILLNRITAETDDAKKAMLEQQLLEELQLRENVRSTVRKIATKLAATEEHLTELLQTKSPPRNFDCLDHSVQLFSKRCFNINKVEYSMRQLHVLVNLCEIQGMDLNLIEDAIMSTC